MKQILQNLRTGVTEVADVPSPGAAAGHVLIRSRRTLISAGTERMLVQFGRAGLVAKARQQPDKVRMVLNKVRTDGLLPTVASVMNKLDQPLALGYCNVGVVIEVGAGVQGFRVGDRVASNGRHAEVVNVPVNLCARVPDAVGDDEAAFTVLAAVALQGIRLVQPTLGESVAVFGLGVIGLLAVQLLRAHGCRVLGLDYDPAKLALARQFGAEVVDLAAGADPLSVAATFSRERGMDAVVIAASTKSSEPVSQAAAMCRKRGRIVLVGVTGLELSRADFYEKELTFQVSCSYGPGRYDPEYEQHGRDYPAAFVRWTEQRNFEAVLDMMADRRFDVMPLVSHRFDVGDAARAYEIVGGSEPSLGILLDYPGAADDGAHVRSVQVPGAQTPASAPSRPALSFAGSGNYATSVLMPAFRKCGARLRIVASATGVTAVHAARKFGFHEATTDTARIFGDAATDAVVIITRHDSHAALVAAALRAGKHVFVEKPLALNGGELDAIAASYVQAWSGGRGPLVMVGFNRRFAPHVQKMKALLAPLREPKAFVMTVNAGAIPKEHWTQDLSVGGGRIIGEGCHFIDLLRFLAGAPISGVSAQAVGAAAATADRVTFTLRFEDGSLGTVHYLANGHRSFPKERLEVFCAGRILQLDNFRRLTGYGWQGFGRMNLWSQDKGNAACAAAFVDAVEHGRPAPIAFDELVEVTRASFDIAATLATGQ